MKRIPILGSFTSDRQRHEINYFAKLLKRIEVFDCNRFYPVFILPMSMDRFRKNGLVKTMQYIRTGEKNENLNQNQNDHFSIILNV